MSQIAGGVQLVFEVDRSRVDSFLAELRQGVSLPVTPEVSNAAAPAATFAGTAPAGGTVPTPAGDAARDVANAVRESTQQMRELVQSAHQPWADAPRAWEIPDFGNNRRDPREDAGHRRERRRLLNEKYADEPAAAAESDLTPAPAFARGPRYPRQRQPSRPRSGGGGGGRRGQWGRLTRVLSGGYAVFEGLRLAADAGQYNIRSGLATSDRERLSAEEALQRGAFGIPIAGQVAALASLPYRAQTETTAAQAAQQDQFSASLQQAMQFAAGLQGQGAAYAAGAPGSDQFRRQEIENRARQEQERIRQESEREQAAIDAREQSAKSAATAAQQRYDVASNAFRTGLGPGGQALPQSVVDAALTAAGVQRPDVAGADTAAEGDANRSRGISEQRRQQNAANAERQHQEELKELDYQRGVSLERAEQRRGVAKLEADYQPMTARAEEIFDSARNSAESARHQGRSQESQVDLETGKLNLEKYRRDILTGGSATFVEDASSVDFGGKGATGLVSAEHEKDDTGPALDRIEKLIETLVEEMVKTRQEM